MVCILWFSRGLGTVPPWQRYIRGWLIYLLCLVFQLSRWLMCFGYRTYSKSLNLELMRLSRRRRPRRRDGKIEKTKTNKMNCLLNTRLCYNRLHLSSVSSSKGKPMTLQLLRSLFTALNNIIAARADHLYIMVHMCSSSCSEAGAAAAVRTSEVLRWNGKHWRVGGSFDRTGGERSWWEKHWARWLQVERIEMKRGDFCRYTQTHKPLMQSSLYRELFN